MHWPVTRQNNLKEDKTMIFKTLLSIALCVAFNAVMAAELSREQVVELLENAAPGEKVNLRRKDLTGLDLSGLDFRQADLWGADLRRANLSHSNLSGLNLDLTVMVGANFEGADLSKVSIFAVSMMRCNLKNVDFSGSRVIANLDNSDLTGANLRNVRWGADMKNQPMGLMRVSLKKVKLVDADLTGADLSRAMLMFADLTRANLKKAVIHVADLRSAVLKDANLQQADLTSSNLMGADVSGANFEATILKDVKGWGQVRGLSQAKNVPRGVFLD